MKKLTLSLASIVALSTLSFAGGEIEEPVEVVAAPAPVAVEEKSDIEISANMGFVTRYIWRGMDQNLGKTPAVQAGIDVSYKGFYVGTWGSNVDFGTNTNMELDVYAGYANEIAGIGFDIGFISYLYPGDTSEFEDVQSEVYIKLSKAFGDFSVGANYFYTVADNDALDGLYTAEVSASYKTLYDITLAGNFGMGDYYEGADYGDGLIGSEDDYYYSVGVSKTFGKFDLGVTYTGYYNDLADDTLDYIVASVSTSF